MLQKERYILSEYNRLTGSRLEPLMKRCTQDRWQWRHLLTLHLHKVHCGAWYWCSLSCNQVDYCLNKLLLFILLFIHSYTWCRLLHADNLQLLLSPGSRHAAVWLWFPFQTLDGSVVKQFIISNSIKVSALCNILLKSALGRVSCVWRVEKAVHFYFTNTFYPFHCIWDSIFRKAQCFRNEIPRQTLKKGESICEQPSSAAIIWYAFMVATEYCTSRSQLIIMLTS